MFPLLPLVHPSDQTRSLVGRHDQHHGLIFEPDIPPALFLPLVLVPLTATARQHLLTWQYDRHDGGQTYQSSRRPSPCSTRVSRVSVNHPTRSLLICSMRIANMLSCFMSILVPAHLCRPLRNPFDVPVDMYLEDRRRWYHHLQGAWYRHAIFGTEPH